MPWVRVLEGLIVVMNTEAIRPWPPGERLTIGLTLLKETQSRPRGEADAASVERRREARLRTLAVHARRRVLCKYVCGAKTRVANAVHRHEHLRRQSEVLNLACVRTWRFEFSFVTRYCRDVTPARRVLASGRPIKTRVLPNQRVLCTFCPKVRAKPRVRCPPHYRSIAVAKTDPFISALHRVHNGSSPTTRRQRTYNTKAADLQSSH